MKNTKVLLLIFLLVFLCSCRKQGESPEPTDDVSGKTDITTDITEGTAVSHPITGTADPLPTEASPDVTDPMLPSPEYAVREIRLPGPGERIEYSPALEFFTDLSGNSLYVTAAERIDNKLYFHTARTEPPYDMIAGYILSPDGELFVGWNYQITENGTVAYYTELYNYNCFYGTPDDRQKEYDRLYSAVQEKIRNLLGDAYDAGKIYQITLFALDPNGGVVGGTFRE